MLNLRHRSEHHVDGTRIENGKFIGMRFTVGYSRKRASNRNEANSEGRRGGLIVNWFVTTLIKTPGHAPADTVASAAILNQIRMPGGVAQVTQQLMEARRRDPAVQFLPKITVDIIGSDHLRAGEIKEAIDVFKLNLLAYPDSADAHDNLADAYFQNGQRIWRGSLPKNN